MSTRKKKTDWDNCKAYFGFCCSYCGLLENKFDKKTKLTKDHFRPSNWGKIDAVFNIVPACQRCNSSKGKKNVYEWYTKQPFYSVQRIIFIENYLISKML